MPFFVVLIASREGKHRGTPCTHRVNIPKGAKRGGDRYPDILPYKRILHDCMIAWYNRGKPCRKEEPQWIGH